MTKQPQIPGLGKTKSTEKATPHNSTASPYASYGVNATSQFQQPQQPGFQPQQPQPVPAPDVVAPDDVVAPSAPVGLPQEPDDVVFEEDFTDITGAGLAEEGMHHAKIVDFEKTTSKSGNPQYVWQFLIIAGPSKNVQLKYWTSLLPQARWKIVEALEAIGIQASGTIARFKRSDIVGRVCIIDVAHEDFDGRTTHKVTKVYPPTQETFEHSKNQPLY